MAASLFDEYPKTPIGDLVDLARRYSAADWRQAGVRAAVHEVEVACFALADIRRGETPLPDPAAPVPGKVGRDHPSTARRAAYLAAPRAGTQRARTIQHLYLTPAGLTAAQLADRMRISRNQMGARLLELREQGWVTYAAGPFGGYLERATDEQGNMGLVQVLTAAGRGAWSAREETT